MVDIIRTVLNRVQGISLKWKLLIPFLFFAFAGTTTLVYIGLTSQQRMIREEERKEILQNYYHFLEKMETKEKQVLSLARMISENPEVKRLLAIRDRQALKDLLMETYHSLKENFDIGYFHFHIPPATSFLRLHYPDRFGEEMSAFRQTIMDATRTKKSTAGLERGVMGFGIRGVAPIFYRHELSGTVEIGYSFGEPFLKEIHEGWGVDLALYEIREDGFYQTMAVASEEFDEFFSPHFLATLELREPSIFIAPGRFPGRSILFGPVKDYSGNQVALVEINMDRSEIQHKLLQTRNLMALVGLTGIAVSFVLTFLVASLIIRPIKEIVKEAQDIARGERESRLEPRPADEMGTLTQALNTMLEALKKRRIEVEEYARNLEKRVQERTADLVISMENYRTLVENVPLIVYRVLEDGTTEFVNSYLTESLGYSIEEAVGNKGFWKGKICGSDNTEYRSLLSTCFSDGEECRIEREVQHRDGRPLTFIDHAIPAKSESGRVKWIDGIMMDITELKRLQDRALRTEEIKLLGEISARMAHEIRNPLATSGGFARRIRDSLPEKDPNRRLSQIIVDEVARMESFLKILLSSIGPFELSLTDVDLNELLRSWVIQLEEVLASKGIRVVEEFSKDLRKIQADEDRINQAFENILKHAIVSMPDGEGLFLSTERTGDHVIVTVRHRVDHLSEEDLEQFFFPHIEDRTEWEILDLPLSKIIIHRHGGKIDLFREGDHDLLMKIELPIGLKGGRTG